MSLALPPELARLPLPQAIELAKRQHLGVWTERVRGFDCAPFQWEWCELAMTQQRLTVVAPRDHSKALALDTLVLRPDGTHTPIGQLAVGDEVVDRSGAPTRVTALSPVFTDHDCYRLVLDDGQTFVADAGHRWITHYAWRGERTVTTEDIAADTALAARRGQRHVIDCAPWDSPDTELDIDPYILGVWLGDGSSRKAEITTADPEVVTEFELAGYEPTYRYRRGEAESVGFVGGLWRQLRLAGVLGNKHVPDRYLRAGTKQRLALLQGLLDSDGTCSVTGQVVFENTNRLLTEAVHRLAWSLGWKPKPYEARAALDGEDRGQVYGVAFYPDTPVFRLARKADRQRVLPEGRRSKATGRAVRSCDRTLTVPVRCITTEAGTFQIGEGVATHNSETFSVDSCAWRICYRPGIQCVIFTSDVEVAKELKERVDTAVRQHDEALIDGATVKNVKRTDYANGASIRVRTTGQKVRGLHPDHIVGDDVLSDENTITHYQRKKVERWWFATVEGMAHPGTWRVVGRHKVWMPPTTIHLVGTPFHQSDLLMSMRSNPVYRYRRYAAEYAPSDLVPGTCAVEAA